MCSSLTNEDQLPNDVYASDRPFITIKYRGGNPEPHLGDIKQCPIVTSMLCCKLNFIIPLLRHFTISGQENAQNMRAYCIVVSVLHCSIPV